MIEFTNPRTKAEFDDWPIGGTHRGRCVFEVLHDPKRGWRVSRTTTDKAGKWRKPKFTTFSGQCAVVDGDDGRTYVLRYARLTGFIDVLRSDFKNADGIPAVFERDDPELFAKLLALILDGAAAVATMIGKGAAK